VSVLKRLINVFSILAILAFAYVLYVEAGEYRSTVNAMTAKQQACEQLAKRNPVDEFSEYELVFDPIEAQCNALVAEYQPFFYMSDLLIVTVLLLTFVLTANYVLFGKLTLWNKGEN
jgi:hypothetical protein